MDNSISWSKHSIPLRRFNFNLRECPDNGITIRRLKYEISMAKRHISLPYVFGYYEDWDKAMYRRLCFLVQYFERILMNDHITKHMNKSIQYHIKWIYYLLDGLIFKYPYLYFTEATSLPKNIER